MGNVSLCKEAGVSAEIPTKVKNQEAVGAKGALPHRRHKVRVCVAAFDYFDAGCAKSLPRLSAVRDGVRFARMAKDCGGEVREFYDRTDLAKKEHKAKHGFVSDGFPTKQAILDEWKRVGGLMTAEDAFVFYFTGHGISRPREVEEGNEEMMLFMEPDGTPSHLTESEVVTVINEAFPPECHVLFITDCFHSSNLCDLSRPDFAGRPIIHLSAVKDQRHMPGVFGTKCMQQDQPGFFTQCLLETLEKLVDNRESRWREGHPGNIEDFTVTEVYNKLLETRTLDDVAVDPGKQEAAKEGDKPDFYFERTMRYDSDTFRWPLVPPADWHYSDPLIGIGKDSSPSAYSCMKG